MDFLFQHETPFRAMLHCFGKILFGTNCQFRNNQTSPNLKFECTIVIRDGNHDES